MHVKYLFEALDIWQMTIFISDALLKGTFIFVGGVNMRETKLFFYACVIPCRKSLEIWNVLVNDKYSTTVR